MAATQEIFKLEMATKSQIIIDDEIKNIIPPLTDEEYEQLQANIIAEGCRNALVVWNNILLDGHSRYEICIKHNIPFTTIDRDFNDKDEAIAWVILNQFGRRNLSTYDRSLLALKLKPKIVEKAKEQQVRKPESVLQISVEQKIDTQKELAKIAGVSHDTIYKVEKIESLGTPEIKQSVRKGSISINAASEIVELSHEEQKEIIKGDKGIVATANAIKQKRKKQKKEVKEQEKQNIMNRVLSQPITERYKLLQGDMTEVIKEVKDESIDAVITDPPYPREYLPLYKTLAQEAARVLKPGGSLFVMTGQSYLPEILALMTPYIQYHWILSYLTPGGQSTQLWQRKVNTFWKPLLWFTKGEYTGTWVGDVTKSKINDNDKRFHHWGQSESGMADIIDRLTMPGQTILDPFLGGGTTAVVAIKLGRHFVGIDIDSEAIETTTVRLLEVIECSQSNKSEQDGEMKD